MGCLCQPLLVLPLACLRCGSDRDLCCSRMVVAVSSCAEVEPVAPLVVTAFVVGIAAVVVDGDGGGWWCGGDYCGGAAAGCGGNWWRHHSWGR